MADGPTAMRAHHRTSTRRGHRHRHALAGVAIASALGLMAGASVTGPPSAEPASGTVGATMPESTTISLSMAVEPGSPVPLALIKEQAYEELRASGANGRGIDVALIDSGVSPVRGLDQPGKVLYGPDLSNEGAHANVANLDTFGHGTHMAGIIVGDDGERVVGMAPGSRLVSVKIAGATGETDIAQVIAAIDWVVEHRNTDGLNIRVLNLSLGAPDVKTHVGDPLSAAVERAWRSGIVVVAAAGNRGNEYGGIDTPALSPYVIATGATVRYESSGANDTIATWSSGGNPYRQSDVTAPGKSILSFRVPGSMLDQMYPTAVVGERYFVGSGTSQSAAVTSGFVAALLSKYPRLTPDQVKFMLQKRAADMDKGFLDGDGRIQMGATVANPKDALKAPVQKYESALPRLALNDTVRRSWSGGGWHGASWSGGTWSGASWSGASWSGASWSGGVWSGASWSGASWSGASWSGASWSGASWSGASWSGASWSGASWSGASWSGEFWS